VTDARFRCVVCQEPVDPNDIRLNRAEHVRSISVRRSDGASQVFTAYVCGAHGSLNQGELVTIVAKNESALKTKIAILEALPEAARSEVSALIAGLTGPTFEQEPIKQARRAIESRMATDAGNETAYRKALLGIDSLQVITAPPNKP
jgi:hypothetical protein